MVDLSIESARSTLTLGISEAKDLANLLAGKLGQNPCEFLTLLGSSQWWAKVPPGPTARPVMDMVPTA